jgi:hypothetical protein
MTVPPMLPTNVRNSISFISHRFLQAETAASAGETVKEISSVAIRGIPLFFIEWAEEVLRIPGNSFKGPTPD